MQERVDRDTQGCRVAQASQITRMVVARACQRALMVPLQEGSQRIGFSRTQVFAESWT